MKLNLEEEDTKYQGGQFTLESDDFFPQQKTLRLRLCSGSDLQNFLSFYDVNLAKVVKKEDIERWVRCSFCEHSQSYFLVGDGFQLNRRTDMCSRGLHEWDASLLGKVAGVKDVRSNDQQDHHVALNDGKFACILTNIMYDEDSGFSCLKSAQKDFRDLVEVLRDIGYDMRPMGWKQNDDYQSFEKIAKRDEYIDSENLYYSLKNYIDVLKQTMEKKRMGRINTFLFHYLGHGAHIDGEDCLIERDGNPTTLKSLVKLIEDSGLFADKYFFILDCCRDQRESEYEFNEEHESNYVPKTDTNIIKVFASQRGLTTPDVANNTITSTVVEFLRKKQSVEVQNLGKELRQIWDRKNRSTDQTPDVEYKARKEDTLFP